MMRSDSGIKGQAQVLLAISLAVIMAQSTPLLADDMEMGAERGDPFKELIRKRQELWKLKVSDNDPWSWTVARVRAQDIYRDCAIIEAARFSLQSEPAATVAQAGMDACSSDRKAFVEYADHTIRDQKKSDEYVEMVERGMERELTSIVIGVRSQNTTRP